MAEKIRYRPIKKGEQNPNFCWCKIMMPTMLLGGGGGGFETIFCKVLGVKNL